MNIRTQVSLPFVTNLPEDVVTNTFYWKTGDIDPAAERTEIFNRISSAYQTLSPNLSADLSRGGNVCRIKYYNMADPEPRPPILDSGFTLLASGEPTNGSPAEVCCVLSYRGAQGAGINPARVRGRAYIGPFAPSLLNGRNAGTGVLTAVRLFGERLVTPVAVLQDVVWAQHSPTTGLFNAVVAGHVDNAWDTQRRRGISATTRVTLGVPT